MKVAHYTGLRRIEIADAPLPVLDGPDSVRVQVDCVGVCGSDVHYYLDGRIGDQILNYPATLGHECAGTVVEVGDRVSNLRCGDRVAIDPAFSCGACDQCLGGRAHTCRQMRFMGNPGEALGAAAEYAVVPARNCVPIPKTMTLEEAALVEPLSVGLHAVRLAALEPRAKIAILGSGPIGLSVLLCAKAMAACTTYVTDLLDARAIAALHCGADCIHNAATQGATAAIRQMEPLGLDVVFECSGDPQCIDQGQELLRPGGTLVLVGIQPHGDVSFDIHAMRRKELTFKNVRRQNECVAPVIEMIHDGRINPKPLVTHRFPLARISEAFDLVADYRDGVIKAMIEVGSSINRSELQPSCPISTR